MMDRLLQYFDKFKSSGLVLIDQGLVSGTSFLTGILLTRFLGLETYGKFVLLWMIILFGLSVAQALITKPLLSLQPKMEAEKAKTYLSALHGIQLLLSLLATLLSIIILSILSEFQFFLDIDFWTIVGLSTSTGLILAYDFYRKCFFLKNDLQSPLLTDGILAFVQLGGIIMLYFAGKLSISHLFLLITLTYTLVCGIGFLKIIKPIFQHQALNKVLRQHFDFSKWLLGTVLTRLYRLPFKVCPSDFGADQTDIYSLCIWSNL